MSRYILVAPTNPTSLLGTFRGKGAWEEEAEARANDGAHQRFVEYLGGCHDIRRQAPEDSLDVVGATTVEMEDDMAAEIRRAHPGVTVVEDRALPLIVSTLTDEVGTEEPPDRWHLEAIGVDRARAEGRVGEGAGVRIALVDSGVDGTHPEFRGRTVEQAVVVDEEIETVEPSDGDEEGHGTHTAGLACGATVGVAPRAEILALRAVENRAIRLADLLVRWNRYLVQRRDVDIVSLSLGLPVSEFIQEPAAVVALKAAFGLLRRNAILPVVAIGNDGRHRVRYPGALAETLAVGATTRASKIWSSSSSGAVPLDGVVIPVPDLVAPGAGIYSSVPGGRYRPAWGTSQAAPLVAGAAALLRERDETATVEELQETLLTRCRPLTDSMADRQGAGILSL